MDLTIHPLPTVSVTATNSAVCAGSAVTLSGNGASTYTWTGGVIDGQSFVPTLTSTYTVTGTAANGCSATASQTVVVNTPPTADTATTNSACTSPTGTASVINVVGDGPFAYAWTGSASTTSTASNMSAGVYVCTITDVNGCSTPVTLIVNAMNAPTVTLQSQTDVTCFGGSDGAATVSVSGGAGPYAYAWSNNSSTSNAISNVSAGTYTCTVSDVASCEAFLVVTIAEPAALDSTVTINGMTFSANETTSGVTYQWIDCGNGNAPIVGQTGVSFTATQSGSYAVIVTLNTCSVTSACEMPTGLSYGLENTIHLYPNPNNGQFTVESSEDGVLEVFTMTGQLVLNQAISNGKTSVSLRGQAQGTYLARITCGENTSHKRIIIQ